MKLLDFAGSEANEHYKQWAFEIAHSVTVIVSSVAHFADDAPCEVDYGKTNVVRLLEMFSTEAALFNTMQDAGGVEDGHQ